MPRASSGPVAAAKVMHNAASLTCVDVYLSSHHREAQSTLNRSMTDCELQDGHGARVFRHQKCICAIL